MFPSWLVLECLDKLGAEAPNTRIELIETVLGHRTDLLSSGAADLAIFPTVPPGFSGDALMRERFAPFASPQHPLHKLGRKPTQRDRRSDLALSSSEAPRVFAYAPRARPSFCVVEQ